MLRGRHWEGAQGQVHTRDRAFPLVRARRVNCIQANVTIESLIDHAKACKDWSQWRRGIEDYIREHRK